MYLKKMISERLECVGFPHNSEILGKRTEYLYEKLESSKAQLGVPQVNLLNGNSLFRKYQLILLGPTGLNVAFILIYTTHLTL